MGVHGLTSYIRKKGDKYFCDYRLHDTKLIIDGSNLIYFLYSHFQVSSHFGGDYDDFAEICKDFFNTLSKCNVTPIVVFDGADDPNDMKLSTVLQRMFKQLRRVDARKGVLPLLSMVTLRQVLVELKIAQVACLFEADREIAVLANKLKCPVLSDDSDFFVFNLDYGSISMGAMAESVPRRIVAQAAGKSDYYLPVRLYKCQTFLMEEFGIERDECIFPVFATLIGNDYFDPPEITITSPKHPSNQLYSPARDPEIIADWLRRAEFESGNEACEHISEQMPYEKGKQFKESVKSYSDIKDFALIDLEKFLPRNKGSVERKCVYLDGNDVDTYETGEKEAEETGHTILTDYTGKRLPSWFLIGLIRCEIDCTFLLNAAVNHRLIFKAQMEILSERTSYACSQVIRRLIYRIVTGSVDPNDRDKQSKNGYIEEYDRETEPFLVEPVDELPDITEIPSLENIPQMSRKEKLKIFIAAFGSRPDSIDQSLDETSQLFVLVLRAWMKNSKPKVTECHLTVLIVGVIALHAFKLDQIPTKSSYTVETEPPVFRDIKNAVNEKKIVKFIKIQLRKHFSTPRVSLDSPGVMEVVHAFVQFQTCYLYTFYLNQVLQSPVRIPRPSMVLNCTFLYNFYRHLQSIEDPGKHIDSLLGKGSAIHSLFHNWKQSAMDIN
ncbi:protein asteroid homolog 1-like [Mercenaria mercenaria]|uniref:protein asteroid homolog 1-like n=1 Tax=Mercenaria mercenaria TaxID=6596 RepID=UPI00234F224B|nr:protein asteroid homolog 1-like [Mercenaria mercenaria]XP_045216983.2 protein asteroid homolog 1-like [Mercenaria mercenaria]